MKKNINLLQPFLWIGLTGCVMLTGVSVFYNVRLMYVSAIVTIVTAVLMIWQYLAARKSVTAFLQSVNRQLTQGQEAAMEDFPIPCVVCDHTGELHWANNAALKTVLGRDNTYGIQLKSILRDVDLTVSYPREGVETTYLDRSYVCYIAPMEGEFYMVYFFENTTLKKYTQEYFDSRPSIMLILVDNYEDLQQSLMDNERTRLLSDVQYVVGKYISESGGLMLRSDRDRFTAIVEERHLRGIVASRFLLLEQVRDLGRTRNQSITLSIGVGRDADGFVESEQLARQALDMALGRGGDQAAVHVAGGYEFFGGVSSGVEKQTKVKARIITGAMSELMQGSENILIMGHRNGDLDCFGAAVGLLAAAHGLGKNAHIVIRREHNLVTDLYKFLWDNGFEGMFIEPETALQLIQKKTLLIVVDTHNKMFLESAEVYAACKTVAVVDHHRKMVGHIDNAVIFYHEPFASSTSEMVAEMLQYFGDKVRIGRYEAEALLAGIMLDTKSFVMKTGVRTFEAAAYLRRMGADTVAVKRLFAGSMAAYQSKTRLVATAQVYRGCAVAVSDGSEDGEMQVTAAQAADELLNIQGVLASFVIYPLGDGVSYSARSMGGLNVQLVMEKLGGGGHHTMAGAQVKGVQLEQARTKLIEAIDSFFAEQDR